MKKLLLNIYKLLLNLRIGSILAKLPGSPQLSSLKCMIYNMLKPRGSVYELNVDGKVMYVNAQDMGITRQLFLTGGWERYETELFKSFIKDGMVVIDIGALYGQYSILASDLVGRNGVVYAFEPVLSQFELLVKNIGVNNCKNVRPLNMAISDKTGFSEVWVDVFNISSASLEKENVLPIDKISNNISRKESHKVETITLDGFIENEKIENSAFLIKMDVGGSEGRIISGAKNILQSNKNIVIFMEYWPEGIRMTGINPLGILHTLRGYGFKIFLIDEIAKQTRQIDSIDDFLGKMKPNDEFNLILQKYLAVEKG